MSILEDLREACVNGNPYSVVQRFKAIIRRKSAKGPLLDVIVSISDALDACLAQGYTSINAVAARDIAEELPTFSEDGDTSIEWLPAMGSALRRLAETLNAPVDLNDTDTTQKWKHVEASVLRWVIRVLRKHRKWNRELEQPLFDSMTHMYISKLVDMLRVTPRGQEADDIADELLEASRMVSPMHILSPAQTSDGTLLEWLSRKKSTPDRQTVALVTGVLRSLYDATPARAPVAAAILSTAALPSFAAECGSDALRRMVQLTHAVTILAEKHRGTEAAVTAAVVEAHAPLLQRLGVAAVFRAIAAPHGA